MPKRSTQGSRSTKRAAVEKIFPWGTFLFVASMSALALQWPLLRLAHVALPFPWVPVLAGVSIFAAAYLLSWAAEVAQLDIPPALALALLALVAVLPEYAVDMFFAYRAGSDPSYIQYAAANMTGSNRLLIGLGWPVVVFVSAWKTGKDGVVLEKRLETEVSILLAATLYAFLIPIKGTLSWVDAVVFVSLFGWYFTRTLRGDVEEPELEEGPAEWIASWGPTPRRVAAVAGFLLAGGTIFLAAEPFADGLLEVGSHLGIDRFILVQWLAPLASEAPEFIVAAIFAARGLASASFNTLLSSKVNQWTLLVGMLPLAFALSAGLRPMHLDAQQREEIFLTAAMSLLAVVILADFHFTKKEAAALFLLFSAQAFYPAVQGWVGIDAMTVRYAFAFFYIAGAAGLVIGNPKTRAGLIRFARAFLAR